MTMLQLSIFDDFAPSESKTPRSRWSLEAFRANHTALLASVEGLMTNVISGVSASESSARLHPNGFWERTFSGYSQASLDGSLGEFSMIWPRWGCVLDGRLTDLPTWGLNIGVLEYSWWPTPQAFDYARTGMGDSEEAFARRSAIAGMSNLVEWLEKPYRFVGRIPENDWDWGSGYANPQFFEWMMGFPQGWTSLD